MNCLNLTLYENLSNDNNSPVFKNSLFYLGSSTIEMLKAKMYFNLGQYDQALKYFNLAIQDKSLPNPQLLETAKMQGYCYEQLSKYRQAICCYNEYQRLINTSATSISEKIENAQVAEAHIGCCLFKLGQITKAQITINQVLNITPYDVYALTVKGKICQFRKAYQESIKILDRALEEDKTYTCAHYLKAISCFHLKKYQEALECFSQVFLIQNPSPTITSYLLSSIEYLQIIAGMNSKLSASVNDILGQLHNHIGGKNV